MLLILVAALIPQAYKLTFGLPEMIADFFPDDAFYYYKTAVNISQGLGSTFDTINFTNGYHPLWMLVCTLVAFITTQTQLYVYLVLIVNLAFVLIFTYLLLKIFAPDLGLLFAALLVCLINWQRKSSTAVFSGLETPVYLCGVFTCIRMMTSMTWAKRKDLLLLALLMAATFLARTSFVLFAPVFLVYLIYRMRTRRDVNFASLALYLALPGLCLTVPYLLWNYSHTGHFQQISGLTKNLWNAGALRSPQSFLDAVQSFAILVPLILQPRLLTIIPIALLTYTAYLLLRKPRLFSFLKKPAIIILIACALVEFLYYFFTYGKATRQWHCATTWITLQIIFVYCLKAIHAHLHPYPRAKYALLVSIFLIGANCFIHAPYYQHRFPASNDHHDMARWIKDNVPSDATIGVWDAGFMGYFSQRKVINLDGLINGVELYNYRKGGRGVYTYILDKKIGYLQNRFYGPPHPLNSILAPGLELLHQTARINVTKNGKSTYVARYLWKINYDKLPPNSNAHLTGHSTN